MTKQRGKAGDQKEIGSLGRREARKRDTKRDHQEDRAAAADGGAGGPAGGVRAAQIKAKQGPGALRLRGLLLSLAFRPRGDLPINPFRQFPLRAGGVRVEESGEQGGAGRSGKEREGAGRSGEERGGPAFAHFGGQLNPLLNPFGKTGETGERSNYPEKYRKTDKKPRNPLDFRAKSWSCCPDSDRGPHPYQLSEGLLQPVAACRCLYP